MTIVDQERDNSGAREPEAEPAASWHGAARRAYIASRRWFWLGSLGLVGIALAGRWWLPAAGWPIWLALVAGLILVADGGLMAINWRGVARDYVAHQEAANRHAQGFWTQRLNGALAILGGLVLLGGATLIMLVQF